MRPKTPEQVARLERREAFRRGLTNDMAELDIDQFEAADSVGISRSLFQRICSRSEDDNLAAHDVPALDEELAVRRLQYLADQIHEIHRGDRYALATLPPPIEDDGRDITRLAALVKEHGEAAAKYAELVATNQWTARNIEDLDRELSEAISAAVTVREAARVRLKNFTGGK